MRAFSAGAVLVVTALWAVSAMAEPPSDRISQGDMAVGQGERVGDAVVLGGSLTVSGWVTGDAVALGGGVHLLPGARVDGDITALGGSIVVEPGAMAFGQQTGVDSGSGAHAVTRERPHPTGPPSPEPSGEAAGPLTPAPPAEAVGPASFVEQWFQRASERLGELAHRLGHMLGLLGLLVVLGMIMLGVAPLRTRALAAAVAAHPGKSLGLGILVIFGAIAAIIVLSVTVVGIPLAAVLAVVVACAAALGLTGVSILIGELLPFTSLRDRQFTKLLLGAGILVVALAIPYAGGILGVIATVLGLGSLALTRLRPGHMVFSGAGGKGPYRSAPTA